MIVYSTCTTKVVDPEPNLVQPQSFTSLYLAISSIRSLFYRQTQGENYLLLICTLFINLQWLTGI